MIAHCQEAGVSHPGSTHTARHTLATALKEAGVPDNAGAALVGQDTQTYTRFYVLADADAVSEAAKAAERLVAAL